MTLIPPDPLGGFPSGDPVGPLPGEAMPTPLPGDVDSLPLPGDVAPTPPAGDVAPEPLTGDTAPAELSGNLTPAQSLGDVMPPELREPPGAAPSRDAAPAQSPVTPRQTPTAAPPSEAPPAPPQPPSLPSDSPPPPPSPAPRSGQSQASSSPKLSAKGIAAIVVFALVFLLGPSLSGMLDSLGGDSEPSGAPGGETPEEQLDAETFYPLRADMEDASLSREAVWDNPSCAAVGLASPVGCEYGVEAKYAPGEGGVWYRQHVLVFDTSQDAQEMFTEVSVDQVTNEAEFQDSGDAESGFALAESEIDTVDNYVVISASDVGPEYSGDAEERVHTLRLFHDGAIAAL